MSRGGRGGRGGSSARGWVPGAVPEDLGIFNALQQHHADRPPPLYPERALRRFVWSDPDGSELWLVHKAEELSASLASTPFNLDAPPSRAAQRDAADAAAAGVYAPPPAGSKRLFAHLEESGVLHSALFPFELVVSKRRAAASRAGTAHKAAAAKFARAAAARKRARLYSDGAGGGRGGGAGAGAGAGAVAGAGGVEDAGADADGGDAAGGGDGDPDGDGIGSEEEEDESDEDFNDYAEAFDDGDGDDGDDGGGGGYDE